MMISRLFKRQVLSAAPFLRLHNTFASTKLDYYAVLGVSQVATQEQIKEAYRKLALKYHPDVSASAQEVHEPSARKFQEITEAYAVLSVEQQRRSYDFLNVHTTQYSAVNALEDELLRRRSVDGQVVREPYKAGTFAAEKQKILAEERAKFNVDNLGRYKGGLPIKGKGVLRKGAQGEALGAPGIAHDDLIHQMKNSNDSMDYQNITPEVAQNFANHQNLDRWVYERKKSTFIATVDYEYFKLNHWRTAWRYFRNLFLVVLGLSFVYTTDLKNSVYYFAQSYRTHAQQHPNADLVIKGVKLVQRPSGILVALNSSKTHHAHH